MNNLIDEKRNDISPSDVEKAFAKAFANVSEHNELKGNSAIVSVMHDYLQGNHDVTNIRDKGNQVKLSKESDVVYVKYNGTVVRETPKKLSKGKAKKLLAKARRLSNVVRNS